MQQKHKKLLFEHIFHFKNSSEKEKLGKNKNFSNNLHMSYPKTKWHWFYW